MLRNREVPDPNLFQQLDSSLLEILLELTWHILRVVTSFIVIVISCLTKATVVPLNGRRNRARTPIPIVLAIGGRRVRDEELRDLYRTSDIVSIVKSWS